MFIVISFFTFIYLTNINTLNSEWFLAIGIPAILFSITGSIKLITDIYIKRIDKKDGEKLKSYTQFINGMFNEDNEDNNNIKNMINVIFKGSDSVVND